MEFDASVVLYSKLPIKELWLSNCNWDDFPPDNIVTLWNRFRAKLPVLERIKIVRHTGIGSLVIILGFADASEKAYGDVLFPCSQWE